MNNQAMNNNQLTAAPMVAAVHDLSSVGRCALTVVIPAIAAMGIQPIPLPTAVLSTHTGGYTDMASRDLTDYMNECVAHWKTLGLKLDAIYSGYLAGVEQEKTVKALIHWQRSEHNTMVIVDPAMGDDGELYSAVPKDMPEYMRSLCNEADLITPNLTEASLMLNLPYPTGAVSMEALYPMLRGFDAKVTIITSVTMQDGQHANVCHVRETGETFRCVYRRIPEHYPGTGDLFSSVLTGYLVKGEQPDIAMCKATAFLEKVIEDTWHLQTEVRAGVQLEKALRYLMDESWMTELPMLEKL